MAKSPLLLVLGLAVASGCTAGRSGTENVPTPSFNAPVVLAPTPPAMPNYTPAKKPEPAPVAPTRKPAVAAASGPADWKPKAPARPWRYIVIHHSDTSSGSAARFDKFHKDKGWDELGYHFVIGNGSETADGKVEVGPRWPKQKWGAHTKTPDNRYNDFGIGICFVGNFQETRPTPAQMQSAARLIAYLMKTYKIPAGNIIGHGDAKATDCPGKYMSVATLRRMATQMSMDDTRTPDTAGLALHPVVGQELLQDAPR